VAHLVDIVINQGVLFDVGVGRRDVGSADNNVIADEELDAFSGKSSLNSRKAGRPGLVGEMTSVGFCTCSTRWPW